MLWSVRIISNIYLVFKSIVLKVWLKCIILMKILIVRNKGCCCCCVKKNKWKIVLKLNSLLSIFSILVYFFIFWYKKCYLM